MAAEGPGSREPAGRGRLQEGSDQEKAALRNALGVVTGLTVREIAARLGISASLLYAYLDPLRPHRPGAARLRELAALYRAEAGRLLAAATELERAAFDDFPPPSPPSAPPVG